MSKLKNSKIITKIKEVWNNKFFQIVWVRLAILAIALNLLVESLSRHSLGKGLVHMFTNPIIFLYNALMIFFTLSLACIVRKRLFMASIISILWVVLGVANFVITSYRKTPFTAPDLLNVMDAFRILPKYFNGFQVALIGVLIVLAIAVLVILGIKSPKVKEKINYLKVALISVAAFAAVLLCTQVGVGTGLLAKNFGNIMQAYKDYGFGYCFTSSVFKSGIEKPKDYSKDKVEEIVDAVETSAETKPVKEPEKEEYPNIIFVQLESEFDPTLLKGVTYSEDPIPNLRKLYSEYSSGYLSVPAFGAGTANTEFEVITGMNLDDFGPGEYPYKTVLRNSPCESICYDLKSYGYTSSALHDNSGNFYSRNSVFPRLGFDTFTSMEYIEKFDTNPTGWAKDACLTDQITGILDASPKQDFIYTISVQGHGDYPENTSDMNLKIKVSNNDVTGNPNGYEYYVNQVHEMDQFVKQLTDTLSKRKEKTIVVFYGDHLPTFDFTNEKLDNGDIFQTEYVIWNNFNMKKIDMNMQAYQLSSVITNRVGITGGVISKLHQAYMSSEDPEEYLSKLKLLEYDILYGECDAYNGTFPYTSTNMKMGFKDIRVTGARNISGHAVVKGQNFTPFSVVKVNDEKVSTIFDDNGELVLDDYQFKTGDHIAVIQATKEGSELSSTSIFVYN